ncbi:hypothetical protein AX15_007659 [Amanita polypyramis BW_CC]|nr:hypothetical protein AX15_007659 [Amanita polypyramis BW_CC]
MTQVREFCVSTDDGSCSVLLGIEHSPSHLPQFKPNFASSPTGSTAFNDPRDTLLFPPRTPSPPEIYRYYKFEHCVGHNRRSAHAQTGTSLGLDVQSKTVDGLRYPSHHRAAFMQHEANTGPVDNVPEEKEKKRCRILMPTTSPKFLLAGGAAGVVSRTCTAPFDRLKIFLITRPPDLGGCGVPARSNLLNIAVIQNAVARIYAEGGILAFWTGNGLSVAKVFPESAIKFFTYESAKRAFARYWDGVENPRDISGTSRFLSGGIGGISSQLAIYPVETLKTQMMSTLGKRRSLVEATRHTWLLGGLRAYYRGLMVGLIGVFPYSAIDMSTFEALNLAYVRSTGKEKPGVLAVLAFGSISGSVGAISVYPLNLVRTRLQASGSPGHPQQYKGVWDVAVKTWEQDGWRGFYRGLFPTLAKVIPSVSITYAIYEYSKRRLGV